LAHIFSCIVFRRGLLSGALCTVNDSVTGVVNQFGSCRLISRSPTDPIYQDTDAAL
jgi:hypothetical protein